MTEIKVTIKWRCLLANGWPGPVEHCGKEFDTFYAFLEHHTEKKHRNLQIIYDVKGMQSEVVDTSSLLDETTRGKKE